MAMASVLSTAPERMIGVGRSVGGIAESVVVAWSSSSSDVL
jgi:hypothetical protein